MHPNHPRRAPLPPRLSRLSRRISIHTKTTTASLVDTNMFPLAAAAPAAARARVVKHAFIAARSSDQGLT
jgi:hypothetical protein